MPPKKKFKLYQNNKIIFKCGNPLCDKVFSEQRYLTRHLSGINNACGKVIKSFQHFQDSKPPAIDRTKLIGIHPKDHLSITDHTNQYFDNINWPNANNSASSSSKNSELFTNNSNDNNKNNVIQDQSTTAITQNLNETDQYKTDYAAFSTYQRPYTNDIYAETTLLKLLQDSNAPNYSFSQIMEWTKDCNQRNCFQILKLFKYD